MSYRTLISATQLHAVQQSGQPVMVFDCSYNLADPTAGRQQFAQAHIPGARHVDLHDHLSSHTPQRAASQGRHPLPLPEDFAATLRQWGFGRDMQAVVYDRNGCNFCGPRLKRSAHLCRPANIQNRGLLRQRCEHHCHPAGAGAGGLPAPGLVSGQLECLEQHPWPAC